MDEVVLRAADLVATDPDAFAKMLPLGGRLQSPQSRFAYEVGQRRKNRELIEWLRLELQKIDLCQELSLNEIIEYKQQLFAGYFDVLVKDIGKSCQERGHCLQLVWQLLSKLMGKVVTSLVKQLRNNQQENLTEQKDLHCMYQRLLDNLSEVNTNQRKQLEEKQEFIDNLIYNLRFKRRQIRKLYSSMRIITEKVNEFKIDYIDLQNEHIELQMFIKDIGRETAEMLVERRRLINQQKNKRIKMNQSKRRNRKEITLRLANEDLVEVNRLRNNLESNYHTQKKQRGNKFLMDCELEEFAARLPEEILEDAPFVVDSSTYGFVDQAVSALEIEAARTRNFYTETNFIDRHKNDQLRSRGVQVYNSELLSMCCVNVGCQTVARNVMAPQSVDIAILPSVLFRTEEVFRENQARKTMAVKKFKAERPKEPVEEKKSPQNKNKPKTPQQKMLRKQQSQNSQNDRNFERKVRGGRRLSNPTKKQRLGELDEDALEDFEQLEEIRAGIKRSEIQAARANEIKVESKPSSPEPPILTNKSKLERSSFANFKKPIEPRKSSVVKTVTTTNASKRQPRRNAVLYKEEAASVAKLIRNKIIEEAKLDDEPSDESISLMEICERSYDPEPRKSFEEPLQPIGGASSATNSVLFNKSKPPQSRDHIKRTNEVHQQLSSKKMLVRSSGESPLRHSVESFRSRVLRKSEVPAVFLSGGRADSVQITVEQCLMIVREMNRQSLGSNSDRPGPSIQQTTIVQEALREASKLSNVFNMEKVLYQSLMRSISEVYQLAEMKLSNGQPLASVWELIHDSLMIGYGNMRNGNLLHLKLVHLLSYVYHFRQKYVAFQLFSLLNGLLTDLPQSSIVSIADFELCIRLINGLNCGQQGTTLVVDSIFTTRQKIVASCPTILRGFLGRSHTDEIMLRLHRLIVQVKDDHRICLNRTTYFIMTQILQLRMAYHSGYRSFLLFIEVHPTQKPVMTMDNFEFLLRCMQLRRITLVEAAKRFGDRSDFQQFGSKCMTLEAFCSFALLHDFPTFEQLHRTASESLQPRWETLCDSSQFFSGDCTEMLLAELRSIKQQLQGCHKYGVTQHRLLEAMSDCFQHCRSEYRSVLSACYELLNYQVLDGQSHRMLMLAIEGSLEELYSLSIKLSIDG